MAMAQRSALTGSTAISTRQTDKRTWLCEKKLVYLTYTVLLQL